MTSMTGRHTERYLSQCVTAAVTATATSGTVCPACKQLKEIQTEYLHATNTVDTGVAGSTDTVALHFSLNYQTHHAIMHHIAVVVQ
jgi:hypothetical protein